MRPLLLPPNVIDHFYVGGRLLAALRGVALPSTRRPEEWLAATVHRADDPAVGPSRLSDGRLFADVVAADREGWTGSSVGAPGATCAGLFLVEVQEPTDYSILLEWSATTATRTSPTSISASTRLWTLSTIAAPPPPGWPPCVTTSTPGCGATPSCAPFPR